MNWKVYYCPVTKRYLDPFKIYRLLGYYSSGRWNAAADAYDTNPTTKHHVLTWARRALDMPEIDVKTGTGFLEPDVEQAIHAFAEYVEGKGLTESESSASSPSVVSLPASVTLSPCLDCP